MFAYAGNNPIKYTDPDGNDIWIAFEKIFMLGFDFRFSNRGKTQMAGIAHVTFINTTTNESFSAVYDIRCLDSVGINLNAGFSGGITGYTKYFDPGTKPEVVQKSYEGIFATIFCPELTNPDILSIYGFSASNSIVVGVDPEKGFFNTDDTPWVGINASISFNAVDLLKDFITGGVSISIPTCGIQYSVYKLHDRSWDDPEYEKYFLAARLFSNPLPLPELQVITKEALKLLGSE